MGRLDSYTSPGEKWKTSCGAVDDPIWILQRPMGQSVAFSPLPIPQRADLTHRAIVDHPCPCLYDGHERGAAGYLDVDICDLDPDKTGTYNRGYREQGHDGSFRSCV